MVYLYHTDVQERWIQNGLITRAQINRNRRFRSGRLGRDTQRLWLLAVRPPFLAMLLLLKAFDVLFFDFFLLCSAGWNFFPHFYPKVKEVLGPNLFGFNRKTNQTHILLFPLAAAILARVCTLF